MRRARSHCQRRFSGGYRVPSHADHTALAMSTAMQITVVSLIKADHDDANPKVEPARAATRCRSCALAPHPPVRREASRSARTSHRPTPYRVGPARHSGSFLSMSLRKHSPVSVLPARVDLGRLAIADFGERLPGSSAEILAEFGCIDVDQTDANLRRCAQHRDRIAVVDAHYPSV